MANVGDVRIHEVAFCGDVKSWADALFSQHAGWPFERAGIEEFGRGTNKRQDLRVFRRGSQTPVLCGEVKLPGTPEGRSPYDPALMQDAFNKADNTQSPYFFTWNVNTFVLFDRSRWNVPMIQRRVRDWDLGLGLRTPSDCKRPEVQARIRDEFLPRFFEEFAAIVQGKVVEWGMPPDVVFIRSLESHLDWPVIGTRDHLAIACESDRAFAARLHSWMAEEMQWTFDPTDPDDWRSALERAARTLSYIFCNRAIFYEAIRARYPDDLDKLTMPRRSKNGHEGIYEYFRQQFHRAVLATGDYEPIFYPHIADWAGSLVFASDMARLGWQGVFANLAEYNFKEIPYDIVGGIFQKLIAPEERQKFGQYFTNEDIVDVINAFCIRRAGDVVLDPACGSGSFLVRAYHRKAWLSGQKSGGRRHQDHEKDHQELLGEVFGCDIALFAAHLATLNLAARHIEDEENYPCIARGNFFEVAEHRDAFCHIPGRRTSMGHRRGAELRPIPLPDLDAVIGNPPYVRQELIAKAADVKRAKGEDAASYESRLKNTKDRFQAMCSALWPGLKLTGRSDLHCYFWPVAGKMLKEGGHFGFLTSSSWLDVEYGFQLQGWILSNFKLIAVIESIDEPWFADARIKTAVAVLQRCSDQAERDANVVRFVRLEKPIKEILGDRPHGDETARQRSAEALRGLILRTTTQFADDRLRIIPVPQSQLWAEGVKAGQLLAKAPDTPAAADDEAADEPQADTHLMQELAAGQYAAGKWGRFLRAPDIYFRLMRDHGHKFVKLGEITEIRRGITSGCDAFFMPRDVTAEKLREVSDGLAWNNLPLMTPCKRSEVESGKVRIVQAGDSTLHPIETEYLKPEVHSLMQVDRPAVRAGDLDRVALWVNKEPRELAGTYVGKYIRWGAKQTFPSRKSKPVAVPERSTCASRTLWYDLTGGDVGIAFWPMAQQYRHIIPVNPDGLICNHNLFYLSGSGLSADESLALQAVLNCTMIGLFKTYYGRFAGTEGNLKTEVVDVNLLDVPDPRGVSKGVLARLRTALESMQRRKVGHLVEEALMECHTPERAREIGRQPIALSQELQQADRHMLDDAVLEMLGITDAARRRQVLDELYTETARHFRQIRVMEIQKQEQRAGGGGRRFSPEDLAASIWDALPAEEKGPALVEWLKSLPGERETVDIPDGKAEPLGAGHLYDPTAVVFKIGKTVHQVGYASIAQAALVATLANLELRGHLPVPTAPAECASWLGDVAARLAAARQRFEKLAASRTGTVSLQEKTAAALFNWFVHGRST